MIGAILLLASWIGAWSAAPSSLDTHVSFTRVTLREIVHASIGGNALRVRLTNRFGDRPLSISAASIAVATSSSEPSAMHRTLRRITFSGSPSVTIPAHSDVISDTVPLGISPQSDLLVSLYVPGPTGPPTYHHLAYQDNFLADGNRAGQERGDGFSKTDRNWYFLDAVDVSGTPAHGAIALLGDSITNGQGSTIDGNDRWGDALAQRISTLPSTQRLGVLNEAIDGDRILLGSRFGPSALSRFDSDVLSQSGVQDLIVLLGINDIQQSPHQYDARAIEFGLEQLAQRAHMRGLRVIACTITPYEGWRTYESLGERTRLAVNDFIRRSHVFDGIADFDAVVRDPNDVHRLRSTYDSGDHLHPNAAAYMAMAAAIDLSQLL